MKTNFLFFATLIAVSGAHAFAQAPTAEAPSSAGGGEQYTGSVDKSQVRNTIRTHMRDVLKCYDDQAKAHPDLKGKLVLEWDIGDGGKVTSVKPIQSVSTEVDSCVSDLVKSWTFPAPPKDQIARVRFPFVFSKKK